MDGWMDRLFAVMHVGIGYWNLYPVFDAFDMNTDIGIDVGIDIKVKY